MLIIEKENSQYQSKMRVTRKKIQKYEQVQNHANKKKKMLAKIEVIYSPDSLFFELRKDFYKNMDKPVIAPNSSTREEEKPGFGNLQTGLAINMIALSELKRPAAAYISPFHTNIVCFHYKDIEQFYPIRKPIHNRFQEKLYLNYFNSKESVQSLGQFLKNLQRKPFEKTQEMDSEDIELSSENPQSISEVIAPKRYLPSEVYEVITELLKANHLTEESFVLSVYSETNNKDCYFLCHKIMSKRLIHNIEGYENDSNIESFIWKYLTATGLDRFFNLGGDQLFDKKMELWRRKLSTDSKELSEKINIITPILGHSMSVLLLQVEKTVNQRKWVFVIENFKFDRKNIKTHDFDRNCTGLSNDNDRGSFSKSSKLNEDQIAFLRSFYPMDLKKLEQVENKKKICGYRNMN